MEGIEKLSPQEVVDLVSPDPHLCAVPADLFDIGHILRDIDPEFDEFPFYNWRLNDKIKQYVFFTRDGELASGTMDTRTAYVHLQNGCVLASTLWVYRPEIG